MRLQNRNDQFRVFNLVDGKFKDSEPVTMRDTLFGHLFGPDQAVLVRAERPTGEDRIEKTRSKMLAISAMQRGIDGFSPFGAGNGSKQGKVWFAKGKVHEQARGWFRSAEDAVAYCGVLFSECRHGVFWLDGAKVVDQEDRSDGMGYVDAVWLREQGLPVRQVQVRAAFPRSLAKGTMLPVEGLAKAKGSPFLFHTSQLKGVSPSVEGEFMLGIRDVAGQRPFRSGWTLTQWFSDKTREALWTRYGAQALEDAARVFSGNEEALRYLGALKMPLEGDRELLTSYLRAGLPLRHPWLQKKLREHVRSAWVDAAMGLGLPMSGGMAHFATELGDEEISCPWIADGAEVVVTRYPVRDCWSFRIVRNRRLSVTPPGSIGTNGKLGLDDDQDGDALVVIEEPIIVEEVRRLQQAFSPRRERSAKRRKCSPMVGLARVMVEAMDGGCVGSPTWLIAGALHSGKPEHVALLSDQVQDAVESLKWHSAVDWDALRKVEDDVTLPDWLRLVKDRKEFTCQVTEVEDRGLGRFWNLAARRFQEVMAGLASHPSEFVDYVPAPDGRYLSEVEAVRVKYNRLIAEADGDMDRIMAVIDRLRRWADSKTEDREEWAKTTWWAVHLSASARSTASMAMQAFSDEVLAQIIGSQR